MDIVETAGHGKMLLNDGLVMPQSAMSSSITT